jgi:ketosteroid isomerase-like protein
MPEYASRRGVDQVNTFDRAVSSASIDDQKRAIERWAASWSAHDLERLLLLFTEDLVYEDVPMGCPRHGGAPCLRQRGSLAFP